MVMHGEYGYMEEGQLGRPYNLRLLKRLVPYTRPYRKVIAKALLLTLMITLVNLALPYLSKVALDRYILAAWHRIDPALAETPADRRLLRKYRELTTSTVDGRFLFISRGRLKRIDPVDLRRLQARQILSPEPFYRLAPETAMPGPGPEEIYELGDGSKLLPHAWLRNRPPSVLHALRAADLKGVARVGIIFAGLLLLSFGLGYLEYFLLEYAGQHIMLDIRIHLFERLQAQGMRFFDRHPVGRLVTRVTNDVENLNEMFKSVMVTVFKDLFLLTGILGVLLYLNWHLALYCFILIPLVFGVAFLFSFLAREAFRQLRASVSRINAFLQERLSGMRIIQLLAAEESQENLFASINRENFAAGMRQIRIFAVFMPIMELFSALAVALLIWRGGSKVLGEQLTLGSLVAFIGYMQMFFKPIRDISEKYNIMQSAMASTERIFEFMDHSQEIPAADAPVRVPRFKGYIRFQDVSFAYDPGRPVLSGISLEVKPGETVAIVGPTGSGKSTLISLIQRFYDPDEGSIQLDGVDLRNWDEEELHRRISLCLQDVFIFSGSLAENITLGREWIGWEDIKQSARQANAWSFIGRLPQALEAEVGEGGVSLSAGERQLLSFARALAGDPPVLILDEATSSVDPETELLIQKAISRIVRRRTTVVVAHRLSTIQHADRILVMHRGRIREQGTHEELLALGGIYERLSRLRQATCD